MIRLIVIYNLLFVNMTVGSVPPTQANSNRNQSAFEMATATLPSQRQIIWQKREIQALVHFGINTFKGREWGSGAESLSLFNPTKLDCKQWVEAAQAFGAKSITFTAKHHDGFCLWPSKYTEYTVKNTPWKNGNGDVVRELSEACRNAGVGFGIYISPADLNNRDFAVNSKKYNDYFCNQLRELLTGYGEICEVFLDGAQPTSGHQAYDFQRYYQMVRELQPNAVISMRGPDVRWVGNEAGEARESEWSVVALPMPPEKYDWPDLVASDLGSRKILNGAKHLKWYPAVADFSLRRKWFWSSEQDAAIRSLDELFGIYLNTVGRNAVFQMNICPDSRGLIPEKDMIRLKEFGAAVQDQFGTNLIAAAGVKVEPIKFQEGKFVRNIKLESPQLLNYVVLQEDIVHGQRVEEFETVLTLADGEKKTIHATTIGAKRILSVGKLRVQEILVRIKLTRAEPLFSVAAY